MKKNSKEQLPQLLAKERAAKKSYCTPKLTSYGDFRRLTRGAKGVVDKDSATAPLRTKAIGGPNF